MTRYRRWQGALVGTMGLVLLALLSGRELLLLVALVALGMVAVGTVASRPGGELRVERSLSEDRPKPGVPVEVTVSVHNEGDRVLPDVRLSEDVPDGVSVVRGTPAFSSSLAPGASATHSYTVVASRGQHRFGDPSVGQRNLPATVSDDRAPEAVGVTEFTCETLLDEVPLREQTIQYLGETPTQEGGSGIEFYAIREYRPGDPINQIDWNRLARTGSLSTVQYREERSVTVVFLVDDREGAHATVPWGGPDSFDLTLYAASRGIVASLGEGNPTGVATVSGEWVPPGTDDYTRKQAEDALTESEPTDESAAGSGAADGTVGESDETVDGSESADGSVATDGSGFETLLRRLPPNAQVVVCGPAVDDGLVDAVDALVARGHQVSVLSPDVATGIGEVEHTVGTRLERLDRANRLRTLRGLDVAVADWDLGEPIMIEIERLRGRWS
jgi:uncharacterized protein (DUF58 family)